jgi:hypothetical protein
MSYDWLKSISKYDLGAAQWFRYVIVSPLLSLLEATPLSVNTTSGQHSSSEM